MKKGILILSFAVSLIAELCAFLSLERASGHLLSVTPFLVLHASSSLFLNFSFFAGLKERSKKKLLYLFCFYFIYFFLPLVQFPAFFIMLYFFNKRKIEAVPAIQINPANEIGLKTFGTAERRFGEGSILSRLEGRGVPPQLKQSSLTYISNKKPVISYTHVRNNICHSSDEVRLLAFSLLSKMESGISNEISSLKLQLTENTDEKRNGGIYSRLAQLHWTLAFMKISDREFENYNLNQAKDYLVLALNENYRYFDSMFLLGRVYLKLKDFDAAEKALKAAGGSDFFRDKAAPYLGEIYYTRKDYKKTKETLAKISYRPLNNKLNNMVDLWTG